MANDVVQRDLGSKELDSSLVSEVISSTKLVNDNLVTVIEQTGRLIVRQNILICLCITAMALMVVQLWLGHDIQKLQYAVRNELATVETTRVTLQEKVGKMNEGLQSMGRDLELLIKLSPTATRDAKGRVSLEFTIDDPTGDLFNEERVVVPLSTSKSHLEK